MVDAKDVGARHTDEEEDVARDPHRVHEQEADNVVLVVFAHALLVGLRHPTFSSNSGLWYPTSAATTAFSTTHQQQQHPSAPDFSSNSGLLHHTSVATAASRTPHQQQQQPSAPDFSSNSGLRHRTSAARAAFGIRHQQQERPWAPCNASSAALGTLHQQQQRPSAPHISSNIGLLHPTFSSKSGLRNHTFSSNSALRHHTSAARAAFCTTHEQQEWPLAPYTNSNSGLERTSTSLLWNVPPDGFCVRCLLTSYSLRACSLSVWARAIHVEIKNAANTSTNF